MAVTHNSCESCHIWCPFAQKTKVNTKETYRWYESRNSLDWPPRHWAIAKCSFLNSHEKHYGYGYRYNIERSCIVSVISSARRWPSLSHFNTVLYTHSTLEIVPVHVPDNFWLTERLTHEEWKMGSIEKAGNRISLMDRSLIFFFFTAREAA